MNLLLPIVLVGMLVMMFLSSRKQKQAQQERQNSINNIKPGDEIVTIGGLHGVFHEEDTARGIVTIDCDGVLLDFDKAAIKTVTPASNSVEDVPVQEETTEEVVETEVTEAPMEEATPEDHATPENPLGFKQED
ncbi:MAG: preprotein translocase subunit YajC [Streptococcaceae bacterium]|jgi:preprotein translocase subunit YajC|nr:preprotein translocase subunit YajC [Streptococcaceae bacterium]